MPMIIIALFYAVYAFLYSYGKVKGTFSIIKIDKKPKDLNSRSNNNNKQIMKGGKKQKTK